MVLSFKQVICIAFFISAKPIVPSETSEAKPAKKGKELKILDPKTGQNLCKLD